MTLRTLAVPAALTALLSLWGCAGTSVTPKPTEPDPLAAGNAAFESKDYARACEELSKAGGSAETLSRAGDACSRDGEAKAERAYKAALAANPNDAAALEALGLLSYSTGNLAKAGTLLEAADKAGGKNPRAALVLGEIYLLSGRCAPAQAAFRKAARLDPGFVAARARLAVTRTLCGAAPANHRSASHASGPATSGSTVGHTAPAGGLTGAAPATGTKEAPKAKPSATINLNDI